MKYVPKREYNVVGKSGPRVDALAKVTGRTKYTADLKFPGMLYGKILRSPFPHAKIIRIDKSEAEKLAGVHAIVCGDDFPLIRYGSSWRDQTLFAREKVRYIGDEVAAVAAETSEIAEEALKLIRVDYEELPAVFDPLEAMKGDAVIIHEKLNEYETALFPMERKGNVFTHPAFFHGNLEKAFEESDLVIEDTFTTSRQYQAYAENHASISFVDTLGRLIVYTTAQCPFLILELLSRVLEMPMTKIRVIAPEVGGAFGGKAVALTEPYSSVLVMATKRPVKMVLRRAEDMQVAHPRHASKTTIKMGFKKEGTLHAFKANLILDSGAFATDGPFVTDFAASMVKGPYRCPNYRIDAYGVYTNKTPCGAMRGFGNPQGAWAREQMFDIAAEKLGISPADLRAKNLVKTGDTLVTGQIITSTGVAECLKKLRTVHKLDESIEGKNRGRGIALMQHTTGLVASSVFLKINEDGTVTVLSGATSIGGGQGTVIAQIVAEVLGIEVDQVNVILGDTDMTPYDLGDVGSRVTFNAGNAALMAAEDAKKQILEFAAKKFGVSNDDVKVKNSIVRIKGKSDQSMSIKEISFARHWYEGGPLLGRGSYFPPEPERDPNIMPGFATSAFPATVYGGQAVDLEIDPETGVVTLLKLTVANDVGQAISPVAVEGQMEGGVVMGTGYGLYEAIHFDGGKVINPSLLDYRIPTAMDVPEIETIIVEEYEPRGPFGAKGVGEPPMVPTAAAIANAIYNAIGVRIKDQTITPEKILKELEKKKQEILSVKEIK